MLLQLVYISTMRAPVSTAECEEILAVSRRNNARDNISGLLVVGTTRFLQLLEGPPAAVRAGPFGWNPAPKRVPTQYPPPGLARMTDETTLPLLETTSRAAAGAPAPRREAA